MSMHPCTCRTTNEQFEKEGKRWSDQLGKIVGVHGNTYQVEFPDKRIVENPGEIKRVGAVERGRPYRSANIDRRRGVCVGACEERQAEQSDEE